MLLKHFAYLLLLCLLSILQPSISFGQQNLIKYKGSYTLNQYKGIAQYSYFIEDNDTLKDGVFSFLASDLNELIQRTDRSLSVSGNFNHSIPNGQWKFEISELTAHQLQGNRINNNHYQVKVDGRAHIAFGKLENGLLQGKWVHLEKYVHGSEFEELKFKSSIEYSNGVPFKNFKMENDSSILMGFLLRNGLANDSWEMFSKTHPEKYERWYFKNGVLDRIQHNSVGDNLLINVFNEGIKNPVSINLDQHYLDIVKLHLQLINKTKAELKTEVLDLLYQNSENYKKVDTILSAISAYHISSNFKVLVPNYALNKTELELLDSIKTRYKYTKNLLSSHLNSSQLNLLKLADDEVACHLKALEILSKKPLTLIGAVVNAHENNVLSHVERENLLPQLAHFYDCNTKTIEVASAKSKSVKQYSLPNNEEYDFKSDGLLGLYNFAKFTESLAVDIDKKLNLKQDLNNKEQELIELEESLFEAVSGLNQYTDSLKGKSPKEVAQALKRINEFANQELSKYSALKEDKSKVKKATSLQQCIDRLLKLSLTVYKVTAQQEEIEQLYTDSVWNPFISVVMREEVKLRLKSAYKNVLIPFLLDEVNNHLECDKVNIINALYVGVYNRMLELREEETYRLERKLRREKDPLKVLDLLSIKIKSNYVNEK